VKERKRETEKERKGKPCPAAGVEGFQMEAVSLPLFFSFSLRGSKMAREEEEEEKQETGDEG